MQKKNIMLEKSLFESVCLSARNKLQNCWTTFYATTTSIYSASAERLIYTTC